MGPSSSCSSPRENSHSAEDWSYSLELAEEYAFDGEVGKWLNEMVPIPVSALKCQSRGTFGFYLIMMLLYL